MIGKQETMYEEDCIVAMKISSAINKEFLAGGANILPLKHTSSMSLMFLNHKLLEVLKRYLLR